MSFLKVNADNSIDDVLEAGTGQEVTAEDMQLINKNKYGHAVFDFIDGAITLNQSRYDALVLNNNKALYINELIETEKKLMARERLTAQIQAVENVTNQAALDALIVQ